MRHTGAHDDRVDGAAEPAAAAASFPRAKSAMAGAAAVAALALVPPASANTASLTLTAIVPAHSSVAVAVPAFVSTETDPTRRLDNAPLARFITDPNSTTPVSVTVVSENAQRFGRPVLADGDSSAAPVPYTLTYGDQQLAFDHAQVVVNALDVGRNVQTLAGDLKISTASPAQDQARLSDTLHFIVRAN